MTTPKPASAPPVRESIEWAQADAEERQRLAASAPPADAILAFLNGEAPLDGVWFGEARDRKPYWWRKYLPLLAASAQVREAEPCGTCNGVGLIGGPVGQTPESLDWIEEPCPDCYPPIKPAAEPAPECIPLNQAELDELCASLEPVPVAQDIVNHAEALALALLKRDSSNLARCYIEQQATIADHARREAELRERADFIEREGMLAWRVQHEARLSAEASLAACRADAERYRFIRDPEIPAGEKQPAAWIEGRGNKYIESDWLAGNHADEAIDAAIDALRQEAP